MRGDTISYQKHMTLLQAERDKFYAERDRRYTEVSIEKEKALKIKEVADLAALGLAREIQTYKDEKANQLREQINSERGEYTTRAEMKPVLEFVASQQGRSTGLSAGWGYLVGAVGILFSIYAVARG